MFNKIFDIHMDLNNLPNKENKAYHWVITHLLNEQTYKRGFLIFAFDPHFNHFDTFVTDRLESILALKKKIIIKSRNN